MKAGQHPSANAFVVRIKPKGRSAARERLAALGEIEEVEGGGGMLMLRVAGKSSDPKAAWKRALSLLRGAGSVQPVLLDEDGRPTFPTGEVTVRFKRELSDAELREFAAAKGLSFRRRNEFVREQAIFEPARPEKIYLPDVVEEIAEGEEIRRAWANTLARYTRI